MAAASHSGNPPPGQPLELVRYDSSSGHFHVGEAALDVLQRLKGPISVVAVCGRARQVRFCCACSCSCRRAPAAGSLRRGGHSLGHLPQHSCPLQAQQPVPDAEPGALLVRTAGQELHPEPAAAHNRRLHHRQHHAPVHQRLVDVEHAPAAAGRRWQPLPHRAWPRRMPRLAGPTAALLARRCPAAHAAAGAAMEEAPAACRLACCLMVTSCV